MMPANRNVFCRVRARQRGIVVFVALIAMVVLSLAAVALLRAVDTSSSVAGNLAFRQAANALINTAVEQATDDLFLNPMIADTTNDDPAHNYFATIQAGEKPNGVPSVLQIGQPYPGKFQKIADASSGNTARWVIERLCSVNGDPLVNIGKCDVFIPKVSPGKTTMKAGGPPVAPKPIFRVTIRVDGPANTISYAQAQLL
jgi:Tfp pilus assembly protein PilX